MPFSKNQGKLICSYFTLISHLDYLNLNSQPCFFFFQIRAKIIFGLNALTGRSIQPDGSAAGAWNYTNAESFISYTVNKNYLIHGWELGKKFLIVVFVHAYNFCDKNSI